MARPSWFGSLGGVASRIWRRVARRTDEPRHVAQQPLREVGEAQLLEVLHFAADDALVHRLVERDERRLEKLAEPLADEELRQMVLHLADAMLRAGA